MFSYAKALPHASSSQMCYSSVLAMFQACAEMLRVSIVVLCSSAQ